MHYNFFERYKGESSLRVITENNLYTIEFEGGISIKCFKNIPSELIGDKITLENGETYEIKELGIKINYSTSPEELKKSVKEVIDKIIISDYEDKYKENVVISNLQEYLIIGDFLFYKEEDIGEHMELAKKFYSNVCAGNLNNLHEIMENEKLKSIFSTSTSGLVNTIFEEGDVIKAFEDNIIYCERSCELSYQALIELDLMDKFIKNNPLFDIFTKDSLLSTEPNLYTIADSEESLSLVFDGQKIMYINNDLDFEVIKLNSGDKFNFNGQTYDATIDGLKTLNIVNYGNYEINGDLDKLAEIKEKPALTNKQKLKN